GLLRERLEVDEPRVFLVRRGRYGRRARVRVLRQDRQREQDRVLVALSGQPAVPRGGHPLGRGRCARVKLLAGVRREQIAGTGLALGDRGALGLGGGGRVGRGCLVGGCVGRRGI